MQVHTRSSEATTPGNAAKVVITEKQQEILSEFSPSHSELSFLTQRLIILLAFTGTLNEDIAPKAGLLVVAAAGQEQSGGIEVWNIAGSGSDVPGQKQ